MTMASATPNDGGGKPCATPSPAGGAPAPAGVPSPAPLLPSTSEGVAAVASASIDDDENKGEDLPTEDGPLQVEVPGFGIDWFCLNLPGFCLPIPKSALLQMPTVGSLGDWQRQW